MTGVALALALVLAGSGCMTFDTRARAGYDGSRVYSGTREAAKMTGEAFYALNLPVMLVFMLDIPLSFVADTLLLPLTISEESARLAALEKRHQTVNERPSVVTPRADEAPEQIARRLFETCESHLHRWEEALADCYSLDARISITRDAETLEYGGAEYKDTLRRELAQLRYAGEYVDLQEARFEPLDDGRVRILARRASASMSVTTPLEWIVGPGADGGWRVLEERSSGWLPNPR